MTSEEKGPPHRCGRPHHLALLQKPGKGHLRLSEIAVFRHFLKAGFG
jgi:hypothetical protein